MSNDIKAGDLVMVVKPTFCCGSGESLGNFYTVTGSPLYSLSRCAVCGFVTSTLNEVQLDDDEVCEVSRLKKIPPLSDLEDVTTHRQDLIPNEQKEVV